MCVELLTTAASLVPASDTVSENWSLYESLRARPVAEAVGVESVSRPSPENDEMSVPWSEVETVSVPLSVCVELMELPIGRHWGWSWPSSDR